jgi:GDP-L-fucose synthase
MREFYRGKRVLVTGGWGLLGTHLVQALVKAGATVRVASRHPPPVGHPCATAVEHLALDLRERAACGKAMHGMQLVFHLAAVGWGFHQNLRRQPELFTENILLNTTVLDCAFAARVEGYLFTSSAAVYPAQHLELDEGAAWDGPPHAGEAGYAEAKRAGELQARMYHQHHALPVAIVRPANPYGPWDDTDPERAHVIPALIRRALAGEDPFVVWGSGKPLRSFIHAADVARAMMTALETRANAQPINLASPSSMSISDLVGKVLMVTDHRPELRFDTSRPDGPARRLPRMERFQELGLGPLVSIDAGLHETAAWFRDRLRLPSGRAA